MLSAGCACVQSVWCAACACVCAVTINNKQRAATMATHAAVPDQTRDSLLRRRSVSAHEERAWGRGVAGFRFGVARASRTFLGAVEEGEGERLPGV